MSMTHNWLVSVLVVLLCGCASQQTDSFYVENAKLSESKLHGDLRHASSPSKIPTVPEGFILKGHRLTQGDGTVIAFREFNSGPLLSVDRGAFRKISIWLPEQTLHPADWKVGTTSEVVAFATVGNPSFPDRGCWAYSLSGHIKVTRVLDGSASITVDLDFGKLFPNCSEFGLSKTFIVRPRAVKDLTPWDGAAGTSLYEEGIRP